MNTWRRILAGAAAAATTLMLVGVAGGTRASASTAEFWLDGAQACGSDVMAWSLRRAENFPLLENEMLQIGQTYLGSTDITTGLTQWTPVVVDGISTGMYDVATFAALTGTSPVGDGARTAIGVDYTISYGGPVDDPNSTRIEWVNFASNTVLAPTDCPAPTPVAPPPPPPVVEAPLDPPLASTTTLAPAITTPTTTVAAAATSTTTPGTPSTPGVVTASATGSTSPAGVTPIVQSPVVQQLPSTGGDTPAVALAAGLVLLSGGVLVAASRRR